MFKKPVVSLKEDFQALGLIKEDARTSKKSNSLEEAKVVKKKTGAAVKKAAKKARKAYKKNKAQVKRKAAKYRSSAAGKMTTKKHERVVKRMGGTKVGKIIRTSSVEKNGNIIEEISRLNKALLGENKEEIISEAEMKELRKSIKNTHRLASVLAKKLSEYIEKHGVEIPEDILKKHFGEAAPSVNPRGRSKNPQIDPDKEFDKERVGQDQPDDVEDEFGIGSPDDEAKKGVEQEALDLDDDDDDREMSDQDGETPSDIASDDNDDYIGDEDLDGAEDDLDDTADVDEEEDDIGDDGTDEPPHDGGDDDHEYVGDEDEDGWKDDVDGIGEDDDEDEDEDGLGDDEDEDDDDTDLGGLGDDDEEDYDESVTIQDFVEEVNDITGKTEKLLSKLDDKTVTPALAKDVLSSVVNYLGGAMDLYTDLNKYAAQPDYENKNLTGTPAAAK